MSSLCVPKSGEQRRFAIVRHRRYRKAFFDIILRWVSNNFPDILPVFELQELPVRITNWPSIALGVTWLQDPVQAWSLEAYQQAVDFVSQCDERGIPTVNRVDRLLNATKSRGAELMREVGINTPRMSLIHNRKEFCQTLGGLSLPLFVREDWGHSGPMRRIVTRDDLQRIPWRRFKRPVAIELLDVRNQCDGMYRKYRYLAAGDMGISLHLQISRAWITRGRSRVMTPETMSEELQYILCNDPNHVELQRARRALQLDLVAFDYGYTADGRLTVWEANPFPHLQFAIKASYRNCAIHRAILAIICLYYGVAGIQLPPQLEELLSGDMPTVTAELRTDADHIL